MLARKLAPDASRAASQRALSFKAPAEPEDQPERRPTRRVIGARKLGGSTTASITLASSETSVGAPSAALILIFWPPPSWAAATTGRTCRPNHRRLAPTEQFNPHCTWRPVCFSGGGGGGRPRSEYLVNNDNNFQSFNLLLVGGRGWDDNDGGGGGGGSSTKAEVDCGERKQGSQTQTGQEEARKLARSAPARRDDKDQRAPPTTTINIESVDMSGALRRQPNEAPSPPGRARRGRTKRTFKV